ncbi:helix-turn-helix domain-containing protein [Streptomyces venezuelae]|uniref:DNA-binding protein n=1 Tax=Streptomyces venezuelae TaxID=54571 RepID=A0A5P2ASB3_STRVZ|nr:DNA-binding protein [Streptomyces venezuelae]
MASRQPSARPRASGLIHRNVRHTTRYVVVGNHLAQHRELSLVAIGLSVHLQSLPAGTPVNVKALAARFPESELKIASAMRELERYGYLTRTRERLPDGRFVPRTVSYNRPGADPDASPVTPTPPPPPPPPPQDAPTAPPGKPAREGTVREAAPAPLAEPDRPAVDLLAGLRAYEPRLLLSERDVRRLAPGVRAWLERGAHPDAVRRTLCADLPGGLISPAGLITHRLLALLPPPLPTVPPAPTPPDPLQNCDDCDRAFRSAAPGRCGDCRATAREAA